MIYDRADSTTISTVIGICVGVWCLYEYLVGVVLQHGR